MRFKLVFFATFIIVFVSVSEAQKRNYKDNRWKALTYKDCESEAANYNHLDYLARNFMIWYQDTTAKYGPIKDQCTPMFDPNDSLNMETGNSEDDGVCGICSWSNDKGIYIAITSYSTFSFYNAYNAFRRDEDGQRQNPGPYTMMMARARLQMLMYPPIEMYQSGLDKTRPRKQSLSKINSHGSYKAYFVFSMPPEVEKVVKKLRTEVTDPTKLTQAEYQTLRANLAYIGSGRPGRENDHVIGTNSILSGRFLRTQPVHWFLAKGYLQGQFKKILVVPFHSCNQYPSCAFAEMTSIWSNPDQTMNSKIGDYFQFTPKMCVIKKTPRRLLRGLMSREAQQLASDYNLETGIRQIKKLGKIYDLQTTVGTKDKKIPKPFYDTAFFFQRKKVKYFRFESKVFCKHGEEDCPTLEDGDVVMLPFDKFDFVVKRSIDKIRVVNDALRYLKKLKSLKKIYKSAKKKLIDYLESIREADDPIQLSEMVKQIYEHVTTAKTQNEMPNCGNIFKIKVSMFKSAFEKRLFTGMFKKAKEMKTNGEADETQIDFKKLEVPRTYVNPLYYRDEKNSKNSYKNKCPNCGLTFQKNAELKKHIQREEGNRNRTCTPCRTSFSSETGFYSHERKPFHSLNALGQGTTPRIKELLDPVVARQVCPAEHTGQKAPVFRFIEDCHAHLETHGSEWDQSVCKDRLGVPPLNVPFGERDEKGIFQCIPCDGDGEEFKTDSFHHAKTHFASVHLLHSDFPLDNIPHKNRLARYVPIYFYVRGSREVRPGGSARCMVCTRNFSDKAAALQHLASDYHSKEFEDIILKSAEEEEELSPTETDRLRAANKHKEFLDSLSEEQKKDPTRVKTDILEHYFKDFIGSAPYGRNTIKNYYWTTIGNVPLPNYLEGFFLDKDWAYAQFLTNPDFLRMFIQSDEIIQIYPDIERFNSLSFTRKKEALERSKPFQDYVDKTFPHLKLRKYSIDKEDRREVQDD